MKHFFYYILNISSSRKEEKKKLNQFLSLNLDVLERQNALTLYMMKFSPDIYLQIKGGLAYEERQKKKKLQIGWWRN